MFAWGWIMWGHVCVVDDVWSWLVSCGLKHRIFCLTRLTSQALHCIKCLYSNWAQVAIKSTWRLLWHREGGGLLRSSSHPQGRGRATTTCSLSQYLRCEVCLCTFLSTVQEIVWVLWWTRMRKPFLVFVQKNYMPYSDRIICFCIGCTAFLKAY